MSQSSPITDRPLREALLAAARAHLLRIGGGQHAPAAFAITIADARLARLGSVPGALVESLTEFLREEYRERGWISRRPAEVSVTFGPLPDAALFLVTPIENTGASR